MQSTSTFQKGETFIYAACGSFGPHQIDNVYLEGDVMRVLKEVGKVLVSKRQDLVVEHAEDVRVYDVIAYCIRETAKANAIKIHTSPSDD